jgi:hypothetical protein
MGSRSNPDLNQEILPPAAEEDGMGRAVAEQLHGHFGAGSRLIALCEVLAETPGADRMPPIYAAASLLRASAQVASSFARVAGIETRHRSIHQMAASPAPELNSKNFSGKGGNEDALKRLEDILQKVRDSHAYQAHLDYVVSTAGVDTVDVYEDVLEGGRRDLDDEEEG